MTTNAQYTPSRVPRTVRRRSGRRFRTSGDWLRAGILGVLGLITFLPVIMLVELSFKDHQQMATAMWLPTLPLHTQNYIRGYLAVAPYLINSATFVVVAASISIVCSALCAYALARYPFPGRELIYMGVLALLMIPTVLTLIPEFALVVKLKLNDTYLGVWLPIAAGGQAFQVIVLRSFFASVPEELFDSARIDGAGEVRILRSIVLPIAKPILSTLIVLDAMSIWNEYVWPIMVLSDPKRYPVMLFILQMAYQMRSRDLGGQYAAYTIVSLPLFILFAFTSRAFIRGLTSGAVKM